jgi:hypothetical protein
MTFYFAHYSSNHWKNDVNGQLEGMRKVYFNSLKQNDHYVYQLPEHEELWILPTECIYVFDIILKRS